MCLAPSIHLVQHFERACCHQQILGLVERDRKTNALCREIEGAMSNHVEDDGPPLMQRVRVEHELSHSPVNNTCKQPCVARLADTHQSRNTRQSRPSPLEGSCSGVSWKGALFCIYTLNRSGFGWEYSSLCFHFRCKSTGTPL